MADSSISGSNKRKRGKADSAKPENSSDPQPDKDTAYRERKNNCWIAVENFICNFTGDRSIKKKNLWDDRKEEVEKANELLNDPLFILQKLCNSIEPSIMENTRFKSALQEVELALKQSKNPVPIQDHTDEIKDLDIGIKVTREELQFLSGQIKQENAIGDLKAQSLMAARTFVAVSRMLSKVEKSCCITMSEIVSTENPVQEQFLQREDEQLVLHFRPAPDSIQTNQSGKIDDIHNSEEINQEEIVVEVDLTLAFVGVRPEKLILKRQRDQNMDASSGSNDVPGSSDAISTEVNMNLLSCESFTASSMVRSYNVDKHNVRLLNEIFQKNPNIDKEFKFKYPYFQSFFMNTIAESYRSIESNSRILGTGDIKRMDEMVKDMEFTGLELTWLKNMLTPIRQMLRKRLQEKKMRIEEEQLKIRQEIVELDTTEEATT